MSLVYYLIIFLASLVAFFLIDMLWLGLIARRFYRKHLDFLMRSSPNWAAAVVFYLIFVGGLLFFAVLPGIQDQSLQKALLFGAIYGLVTYATYDLTNMATLEGWPLPVVVVDILWGIVLSTSVSWIGFLVGRWLL